MKGTIVLLLVASIGISAYPFERNYQRTELGNAIDKASLKLLKEAYKASSNQNVIASPLGVLILLSLYSEGAGAKSKEEILQVLAGGDPQKTSYNRKYAGLSQEFGNMDPKFLTLANKIYVQNGLPLNDEFSRISSDDYRSGIESIDFTNATAAAAIINQWSDEKTKGHIKSPLSPDAITPDTVAGLFNVIFFQGHWHVPFNASETKDEDFHVDKQTTVKKPTMHLEQSLFYTESEDLDAKLVELPYKEDGFRMVIVLPNEIDGLSTVIDKATEKGLLEDVFRLEPSGRDIKLHVPKFEIKTKLDLNDMLPKVGVSKIFTEGAPGVVKDSDVVVSKAFQEAFVKVDEEGATAGAFTGFLMVPMSWPPPPPPAPLEFKVDHPFLFVILHKDKVLFAGTHTA